MKEYYNNDKVSEINFQLKSGNPRLALLKAEEYLQEYPKDNLAVVYHARALAATGEVEEARRKCEDVIYGSRFHDKFAEATAYYQYGLLLEESSLHEEAIEVFLKTLKITENDMDKINYRTKVSLASAYSRIGKFQDAIDLYEENDEQQMLTIKVAFAYLLSGKLDEALSLANKIHLNHKKNISIQQVEYIKAVALFLKKHYGAAEKFFKNCLIIKNKYYYNSYIYLAKIKYEQKDLIAALDILKNVENIKDYNNEYCVLNARIYMQLGNLDKAKEFIDQIDSPYTRQMYENHYDFARGDFAKNHEMTTKLLSNCKLEDFASILKSNINSLIRMGKYKEALYMLESVVDDVDPIFYNICKAHIYKALGRESEISSNLYTVQQIVNYSRERAIAHVVSHHSTLGKKSMFYETNNMERLFDEVKEKMKDITPIRGDLFDKYYIPYKFIGYDKNGNCNYLIVVVNPLDSNILTMYPLSDNELYMEDEEEVKTTTNNNKAKRLSQIDKFNQRYGNK